MIEVLVDPSADDTFDIRKIEHHAPFVERLRLDGDDRAAVMPVQITALAIVIEQPMAVAKVNFAGDAESHESKRVQGSGVRLA